jgi:cold shock CspA family protein
MQGTIIWWSRAREHGIVSVNQDGKNQRFFLHLSRIASGPDVIKAGQVVQFTPSANLPKDGFLPQALNATVSNVELTAPVQADGLKAGA